MDPLQIAEVCAAVALLVFPLFLLVALSAIRRNLAKAVKELEAINRKTGYLVESQGKNPPA